MNFRSIYILLIIGILTIPTHTFSQRTKPIVEEPTDDLGNVSDAFQEFFFEALKQKAIENYELALDALKKAEKAAKKNPENLAVVYFERGKNLSKLKRYEEAETSLKDALEINDKQLDVVDALYDVYHKQRKYQEAIPLVEKLSETDNDYKEDLANLYYRTKQYQKSLDLVNELDALWGENYFRNNLRKQIYRATGNSSKELDNLVTNINSKPKKEKEYLHLIFLYSEQGKPEKAKETSKELLEKFPKSQLVHLALYKFFLEEGKTEEAINSMKIVFKASSIDAESKYKVLGDFITFVNDNPQYENELEEVVTLFPEDANGSVYEKLGDYYRTKNKPESALSFYEKGIKKDSDNFSLLKNTLLLQIDLKKYDEALTLSTEALEIFPSQALLYLLNGVANNQMGKTDDAIENLQTGLDYLFEDSKMEKDFYIQLQKAYTVKGNTKKATIYQNKINALGALEN